MSKIKGKQFDNNTINQRNMSIQTNTILSGTSVTNKEFLLQQINEKTGGIHQSMLNKNMTANVANVGQKACDIQVVEFPISNIMVNINGTSVNVGVGQDCYFSPNGVIVRSGGNAEKGDYLYWNKSEYNLDTNDEIDFIYLVGYDYVTLDNGTNVTLNPFYESIVVKYVGTDGTTMTVTIDGVDIVVGNVGGQFVWDIGQIGEHTFVNIGEFIEVTINSNTYIIWFDNFGSLIFSVKKGKITTTKEYIILIGSDLISTHIDKLFYKNSDIYIKSSVQSQAWSDKVYKYKSGTEWTFINTPKGYNDQYSYNDICTIGNKTFISAYYFANESDNKFNKIIMSEDNNTWSVKYELSNSFQSGYIPQIQFVNTNVGYAVVRATSYENYSFNFALLKTTDGGENWNFVNMAAFNGSYCNMVWLDENNGWLYGSKQYYIDSKFSMTERFYRVTNGGTTSVMILENNWVNARYMTFISLSTGYVYNFDQRKIFKTVDSGYTWTEYTTSIDLSPYYTIEMEIVNSNIVMCGYSNSGSTTYGHLIIGYNFGETWEIKSILHENFNIERMAIKDMNNIVVYGKFKDYYYMPVVAVTNDGGDTWTQILNVDNENMFIQYNSICFVSDNVGWLVGQNKTLIKTENGGLSWIKYNLNIETELNYNFNKIYFTSNNVGYIVGSNSASEPVILKTTNNGVNWEFQTPPYLDGDLSNIFFYNNNYGWAIGYNSNNDSMVIYTTDGGNTWGIYDNLIIPTSYFLSILFTSLLNGFAVGYNWTDGTSLLYTTTDGGTTWNLDNNMYFTTSSFYDIKSVNDKIYLIGSNDDLGIPKLYTSTDNGSSWVEGDLGLGENTGWVPQIEFSDSNNGMYIFDYGSQQSTIYGTSDGGVTWKEFTNSRIKGYYNSLSKNYAVGYSSSQTIILSKVS